MTAATAAIAGYSVLNDVSMRDWQNRTLQFLQGKTFESSTPLGPWLVTPDEPGAVPGPDAARSAAPSTARSMQDSTTADLLFDVPHLVSYLSTVLTLLPGDVIATGTPSGVGAGRKPPRFLADGELVVTTISGVGELRNRCRAESVVTVATLDWYGCATFRLRIAGITVFLDAYIDRVEGAPGTGLTADDVDECDWIVVGHSHFDHLCGAERIIANTGATMIGSYESVRVMDDGRHRPRSGSIPVAGGERVRLADDVTVTVLPSQHSCVWSHTAMVQSDEVCLGDLGVTWQEQRERMARRSAPTSRRSATPRCEHLRDSAVGHSPHGDGGALLYLFETPEGSLLYQDTSGHWTRHPRRPAARRRDPRRRRSRQRRRRADPGLARRLRRPPGRRASDRAGCCSATTTTGCPASRWRPTMAPLRAAVATASPGTELLEPGYLEGTPAFPPRS